MDSKRVYKKISTIFWFMLATLPITLSIIGFICTFFIHTDSITTMSDITSNLNSYGFERYFNVHSGFFGRYVPSFIIDMFKSLFLTLNISTGSSNALANVFGWFSWVYLVEIMIDLFIWLPRWMHDILDKGVGKID